MHPKLEKLAPPKLVPKKWGSELWIVNNEEFCGKILKFNKGSEFSTHSHSLKREVFFCVTGNLEVTGINTEDASKYTILLNEGDVVHVPRLTFHRVKALTDSVIWEISTHHEDSDSYRVEAGDSQK